MNIPDEGYSRNVPNVLHYISTFYLKQLDSCYALDSSLSGIIRYRSMKC